MSNWLTIIRAAHRRRYYRVTAEDLVWIAVYLFGLFCAGIVVVDIIRGVL